MFINKGFIFSFTLSIIFFLFSNELSASEKKTLKIAHFYSVEEGFWGIATTFASETAKDLDMEFDSYSYGLSPLMEVELIKKVLNDPKTKPDGFIFHNFKMRGEEILELAKEANVPALMFNAGPTPKDKFGDPREKYPLYIGLITPDDEKAGFDLTNTLISIAREKKLYGEDGKIHLCIMEGSRYSNAAILRKKGLLKALSKHKDVVIDQYFDTNWDQERAKNAFSIAIKRYPDAKVFWNASDSMAMGIAEQAKSMGKIPNVDFITGGIDLLPSIQSKVTSGDIAVSIGAHYTESIWAVVLLHDYLKGCDFAKEDQSPIYKSTMLTLSSKSKGVLPINTKEDIVKWAEKIDFKKFSKCYQKEQYSFDARDFFNNL